MKLNAFTRNYIRNLIIWYKYREPEWSFVNVLKLNDLEAGTPISPNDAVNKLKKMKNTRSPGQDPSSVEFLKCFCKQVVSVFTKCLNFGYITGERSVTQKRDIITCLPKGDKPR